MHAGRTILIRRPWHILIVVFSQWIRSKKLFELRNCRDASTNKSQRTYKNLPSVNRENFFGAFLTLIAPLLRLRVGLCKSAERVRGKDGDEERKRRLRDVTKSALSCWCKNCVRIRKERKEGRKSDDLAVRKTNSEVPERLRLRRTSRLAFCIDSSSRWTSARLTSKLLSRTVLFRRAIRHFRPIKLFMGPWMSAATRSNFESFVSNPSANAHHEMPHFVPSSPLSVSPTWKIIVLDGWGEQWDP